MDNKGEIISSCDVDENVALQIWTKGHAPRLVFINKIKNSRKLIRLGWVERRDRKLSVGGAKRGESTVYSVQDFEPVLQRILAEYAVYANFRIKLWKFAVELERALHVPEIVTDKGELNLLSEDKRSSLWIAECTGPDKKLGRFRPFFPVNAEEAAAMPEDRMGIIGGGRGVDSLMKTGAVRGLAKVNPTRWHNPVRVAAAAMLLDFSYCWEDGSEFSDQLWKAGEVEVGGAVTRPVELTLRDPNLMGLGRKLVAFLRHFENVPAIEVSTTMDAEKELKEQGYSRTRRLDFPTGSIGDVPYRVTVLEREDGQMALSCQPESATQRHQGELVYVMPMDVYNAALEHDTMGGPPDHFYTITQMAWACQFRQWLDCVTPYISNFAGLM